MARTLLLHGWRVKRGRGQRRPLPSSTYNFWLHYERSTRQLAIMSCSACFLSVNPAMM